MCDPPGADYNGDHFLWLLYQSPAGLGNPDSLPASWIQILDLQDDDYYFGFWGSVDDTKAAIARYIQGGVPSAWSPVIWFS